MPVRRAEARRLRSLRPCRLLAGRAGRPRIRQRVRRLHVGHLRHVLRRCPRRRRTGRAPRGRAGRTPRRGRERGADLRYNLEISLEEAFTGKTETIKMPTSVTCEVCAGSGAKAGSKPKTCPTCGGYGRVRAAQGFFAIERTCPACHGRGEIIEDPCTACSGAGRVTRERTLSINVPAGVDDGLRIRWPARANRACAADRRGTSTSSCRSSRTRSSSATGPTCSAGCRSRW